MLRQVEDLDLLVTNRISVSDVVESAITGRTGSAAAAVLCRGEGLWAVDLGAGRFDHVNAADRSAVLRLPEPTLLSGRLDLRRSRVWDVRQQGLWAFLPGNDALVAAVNRAHRDAQVAIEQAASSPAVRTRAMDQARKSVAAFYASLGWRVDIAFDAPTHSP